MRVSSRGDSIRFASTVPLYIFPLNPRHFPHFPALSLPVCTERVYRCDVEVGSCQSRLFVALANASSFFQKGVSTMARARAVESAKLRRTMKNRSRLGESVYSGSVRGRGVASDSEFHVDAPALLQMGERRFISGRGSSGRGCFNARRGIELWTPWFLSISRIVSLIAIRVFHTPVALFPPISS